MLMGISFVVSVFLQTVRGFSAIETGLVFTAATVGILLSSMSQERLAKRYAQKTLILAGFIITLAGIGLLLGLVHVSSNILVFLPGLFLIGLGIGTMLTPSVNIVQSAFPEEKQGEISGLSRSISNLGSSLGTAIAGTILVSDLAQGNRSYALAMIVPGGRRPHRTRGDAAPPCGARAAGVTWTCPAVRPGRERESSCAWPETPPARRHGRRERARCPRRGRAC